MPITLVRAAIEQSRGRGPTVCAMALLQGARVLAAVDLEGAKRALAEGTAIAEGLAPRDGRDQVLIEAVQLGAGVDPFAAIALFRRLPHIGVRRIHHRSIGERLVQTIARNGPLESAVELLEDLSVPAGGAQNVVLLTSDAALQRRAMAAARERWRQHLKPWGHLDDSQFFHLFSNHWQKLEPAEQVSWLNEILQYIDSEPDSPGNGQFGDVQVHSKRDIDLFWILNVVRALKTPEEVSTILRTYPDVAKAAETYPMGVQSAMARAAPAGEGVERGVCGSIGRDEQRLMEELRRAHQGEPSAVPGLLAEALRLFREDKDPERPNNAPHIFWPSSRAYQTAMYWAGRTMGKNGTLMLAEIPDTDLALLASIELAAGALGLAEYGGSSLQQRNDPPSLPTHPRRPI